MHFPALPTLTSISVSLSSMRVTARVIRLGAMAGAGNPRLLYRVDADGKRTPVRGAELDDVDQRALRSSIEAAGKDLDAINYFGDVPQTVIAPALLLKEATVKLANSRKDKLPYYPPPE